MHIFVTGLSHTSAPIDLRERLAFADHQVRVALAILGGGRDAHSIAELVILSTCNRTELYGVSGREIFDDLDQFLSLAGGVPRTDLASHLYHRSDMEAARHLFEVAAGLDSLVLGEPQILGQVARALELARTQNTAGPILNRLFQSAVHAGKRVRTETAIGRNPASVSSLAASLAEQTLGEFSNTQIVILGAGEMAELAVESLRRRGARRILVLSRTMERARALAQRWDADASTFEQIVPALTSADILIASTDAPHALISFGMVEAAMAARSERPLLLIDIAVPRDIHPDCANIRNVRLYNMDSLQSRLAQSLARRQAEVPQARIILEDELTVFAEHLTALDMIPIIADLRQRAEVIRRDVLRKSMRRMPDLTDHERDHIEALTRALVKKLLETPTHRLRSEAASERASEYADMARTLFGLDGDHSSGASTAAD